MRGLRSRFLPCCHNRGPASLCATVFSGLGTGGTRSRHPGVTRPWTETGSSGNLAPMAAIRELTPAECADRLRRTEVGRIAVGTADGPVIIPVNYTMDGESVVFRTSAYAELAAHAGDSVAFEIDEIEPDMQRGWSVLVVGTAQLIEDVDDVIESGLAHALRPFAPGVRNLFIKITPRRVTGRDVRP
jgi:nitroimidazol reductase NimA-like FMN-containing flavoprotein (pyridoxamine 5'-phosphate oxidase superfamily)